MTVKQIIVVREDLNMSRGKIASQVAHASMKVLLDAMRIVRLGKDEDASYNLCLEYTNVMGDDENLNELKEWLLDGSFTKIVVYVKSEAKLISLYEKVQAAGLRVSMIIDNGTTEFNGVPTMTCIAIGPHSAERLDPFTKKYPLLK